MKKILIIFVLFIYSLSVFAIGFDSEFRAFYSNPKIVFNKCGVNIQHFLKYIEHKLDDKSGYVVSVHEDLGFLNHFNARWGSKESYSNGEGYYRSNWYFHVFLIIDGVAYDFSSIDKTGVPVREYLLRSYIPKYLTENIFFLGQVDRNKMMKKFYQMDMKIYKLDDYITNLGPTIYEGKFIELFSSQSILTPKYLPSKNIEKLPEPKKGNYGSFKMGEAIDYLTFVRENNRENNEHFNRYKNIKFIFKNKNYKISSTAAKICRALGYVGAFPKYTKELEVTKRGELLIDLSSSLYSSSGHTLDPMNETKSSFRYEANDQHWNRKYINQVACGNFLDALSIFNL